MKEKTLRGLAAACLLCSCGLFAHGLTPPGTAAGDSLLGRGDFGTPALGAGCNTGSTCGGQPAGTDCIKCPNPGANVLTTPPGTGWTYYTYMCEDEASKGTCSGPPLNRCIEGAMLVDCPIESIPQWAGQ